MDELEYYNANVVPKYWNLEVPANSAVQYNIDQPLPDYVRVIIGLMCYTAGVNTSNTALVTSANSDNYFLALKRQGGFPIQQIRLDMLTYNIVGSAASADWGNVFMPLYLECADIDLQSSYILNPGGSSNALMFGFLYIQ